MTAAQRKNHVLKNLFDSDYVKPEDNFRVFKDDNPLRASVHNEALERYEKQLRDQKLDEKSYLKVHNAVVEKDNGAKQKELDLRKSK